MLEWRAATLTLQSVSSGVADLLQPAIYGSLFKDERYTQSTTPAHLPPSTRLTLGAKRRHPREVQNPNGHVLSQRSETRLTLETAPREARVPCLSRIVVIHLDIIAREVMERRMSAS